MFAARRQGLRRYADGDEFAPLIAARVVSAGL